MEVALRVGFAALTFLIAGTAKLLLLDGPGLLVVPLVIRRRILMSSQVTGRIVTTVPHGSVLWLWSNDEDGCEPPKAAALHPTWRPFWRMYAWLALRNRTDNLQFTWWCPAPKPGQVRWIRMANGGVVAWQGWRHYVWMPLGQQSRAVSFGWNYYPEDNRGLDPADPRRCGCGFGFRYTPKDGQLT